MASSLEIFCGKSLNNYTIWQHNSYGYCYQQLVFVLPSHVLLALVSVMYIYLNHINNRPTRPNLKRSTILYVRIVITVSSSLIPVLSLLLKQFTGNTYPTPVVYLVDVLSSVAWVLFSLYLWQLRRQSIELVRTHKPVVFAWIITLISQCVRLSTVIKQLMKDDSTLTDGEEATVIALTVLQVLYLLTLLPAPRHITASKDVSTYRNINECTGRDDQPLLTSTGALSKCTSLGVAEDNANLCSKATLWWMQAILRRGAKGELQHASDVFSLPKKLTTSYVDTYFSSIYLQESATFTEEFSDAPSHTASLNNNEDVTENILYGNTPETFVKQEQDQDSVSEVAVFNGQGKRLTLCRALFKAFGVKFLLIGFGKMLLDALTFVNPLLLHSMLKFMDDETAPMINGYLYAIGMFSASVLTTFVSVHYTYQTEKMKSQVRAALITMVYRKTLEVSGIRLSAFTPGQIINFMSVDTSRVVPVFFSLNNLWSLPFMFSISFYLLYLQVGVPAFGGLSITIILIPITKYLTGSIIKFHRSMMKHKDGRVKLMNEILNGIRVIKFHGWDCHLKKQIDELRSEEVHSLKGIKYLDAFNIYIWATASIFMTLFVFSTYVLMGNELTAAVVFTSLALFSNLNDQLSGFPKAVNIVLEAWVSLKRLQDFMDLEESNLASYYLASNEFSEGAVLSIRHGTFHWNNTLKKIDHKGNSKMMQKDAEEIRSSGRTEQDGDNDSKDYRGCAKLEEIDLTVVKGQLVGIIGRTGSGKSSLFSAILADMDKEKGSVGVAGLDQGFGVATQEPWLQNTTVKDNILFGRFYDAERYNRVVNACALLEDFKILPAGDDTEIGENGITLSGGQRAKVALARAVYQESEIYLLDDPLAFVDADMGEHIFSKCIMGLLGNKTRIMCTHEIRFLLEADYVVVMDDFKIVNKGPPSMVLKYSQYASYLNITKPISSAVAEETSEITVTRDDSTNNRLTEEEEKENGAVKFGIYKSYWKAVGSILASCILVMFILTQASTNIIDWWLSYWTNHTKDTTNQTVPYQPITLSRDLESQGYWSLNSENNTSSFLPFYLGIYQGMIGINSVFAIVRAFSFAYGGVHAAEIIHERLLKSMIKAPISFFDKTPVGRILNRFSSDTYTVDYMLTFEINALIVGVLSFLAKLGLTCSGLPWFILCVIPMCVFYYYIQNYYRTTLRELRRICNISNSTVYSHFSETLAGLPVIKGMRAKKRFHLENCSRLDLNQRAWFISLVLKCWFSLLLHLIAVAMLTAVAVLAVIAHQVHSVDTGLLGLMILYSLSLPNSMNSVAKGLAETEECMVSSERIHHYTVAIPHEPQDGLNMVKPPNLWPRSGVIKFNNVHFSYREDLPKAVNGVSFETRPGEKIGIVGKTGAGKSTLFKVLFRMVQIQQGSVTVDGIDLAEMSLNDARSRLTIIPQDPFLFSSSVRKNLDPSGQFSDSELWRVLEKCHLKDVVTRIGGLEASVGEGGRQFSAGQKQLLCLARAMLAKTKVLCIDEATAGVDMETDAVLQQAIKEVFQDDTVLIISHRLDTVQDCDRILVMDAGKVVKFE